MFPCFLNAAVGRMRTKIRQDHQLRGHVLRGEIRLMIYLIMKIHVYTHDVHVIYTDQINFLDCFIGCVLPCCGLVQVNPTSYPIKPKSPTTDIQAHSQLSYEKKKALGHPPIRRAPSKRYWISSGGLGGLSLYSENKSLKCLPKMSFLTSVVPAPISINFASRKNLPVG